MVTYIPHLPQGVERLLVEVVEIIGELSHSPGDLHGAAPLTAGASKGDGVLSLMVALAHLATVNLVRLAVSDGVKGLRLLGVVVLTARLVVVAVVILILSEQK